MEIEIFERFGMFEVRAAYSLLELLAVAALDLIREQAKKKLLVRQTVLSRLLEGSFKDCKIPLYAAFWYPFGQRRQRPRQSDPVAKAGWKHAGVRGEMSGGGEWSAGSRAG